MVCLRCGKTTEENEVFCPECLEVMEQQPVKPDTPIVIPNRETRTPQKRTSQISPSFKKAKKISRLRSVVFWLILLVIILAVGLALALCILFQLTPDWLNEMLLGNASYRLITITP